VRGLRLPPEVQVAIRVMPPELKRRVRTTLDHIRAIPKVGKPLKRELSGWWSLRVGRVRIIYREAGTVIKVGAIGPRSSIYRDTAQRLSTKR
jgi:mRNA-degrading endonuclease RelE of RelBE toxin-antitoxin system